MSIPEGTEEKLFILKRFNDSLLQTLTKSSIATEEDLLMHDPKRSLKPTVLLENSFLNRHSMINADVKSKDGSSSFKQNAKELMQ